jgi:hypothetical protein
MKRSRRVILTLMGTAAASSLAAKLALARPCEPGPSGFLFPGPTPNTTACNRRGGFGSSPQGFGGPITLHNHAGG